MANQKDNPQGQGKETQVLMSPDLPTVFSDLVVVTKRTDSTYLLRWLLQLPGGPAHEEARILVGHEHMGRIVDLLCRISDHYPTKPRKKRSAAGEV